MRKIYLILCVLCILFGLTACKSGDIASDEQSTEESDKVSIEDSSMEESGEDAESIGEEESSIPEVVENDIGQDSAKMLIMEKLDASIYSVELDRDDLVVNDQKYYTFILYENQVALDYGVAVDKSSGEFFSYDFNGNIGSIEDIPVLADSNVVVVFDGTFVKEGVSIVFRAADRSSSEFSVLVEGDEIMLGVARIEGNSATFTNENGFALQFDMIDDQLNVTETGTNSYGIDFSGKYDLSE